MIVVKQFAFARAPHAALAFKFCGSLKQLAKRLGDARFEAACGQALRIKSPTCKSIRSLLQNRLDQRGATDVPGNALPRRKNVRGPGYYAHEDEKHVD
ncbi:MAG: hypothetical protein ACYC9P_07870 [Rudaea sp.]